MIDDERPEKDEYGVGDAVFDLATLYPPVRAGGKGAAALWKALRSQFRGTRAARVGAEIAPRVLNGANHVFGSKSLARHGLDGVLKSFAGDKVAAFNALERAAQQLAEQGAIRGVFQTTVVIAGQSVTIHGAVVGGTARVSRAFVPIPWGPG